MKSKLFKVLIAVVACFLALWLLADEESVESEQRQQTSALKVSVVEAIPVVKKLEISTTGIIKPKWPLALVANVDGQLIEEFDHIQPGTIVEQGQVIAQVDNLQYVAHLATAASRVAQAKLNLARFLNEQAAAIQLDKGQKTNDYRLHKPHVAAARAELEAAEAGYKSALKYLNDTQIKAPFDAVILAKYISPAKQITKGEQLYTLASSQALNIDVNLSDWQWQQIFSNENIEAYILGETGADKGRRLPANVRYVAPQLNNQTRQHNLMLSIEQPYKSLSAFQIGQQVRVGFTGQIISHAVTAPATVLTRDNKVWTIANDELQLESIALLEEGADQITFSFDDNPELPRKLVRYPLSTMLAGQQVEVEINSDTRANLASLATSTRGN